ncbi:MAG TPA: ATP-binding protein [Actinomycetota bacterium]|nr:ATP-binding protein [Actinomycetota bacterium]
MTDDFSEEQEEKVGRVLGLDPATSTEFKVVLDSQNYLQLDDLVMVRTRVPKAGEIKVYGLVTEASARYEGARFESDMQLIAEEGSMPAELSRSAAVQTIRVDPEVWVAPDPGEPVYRVRGEERNKALYADQMERKLPVGFAKDGLPIFVDLDFFDGRKGGHISISGISGVATKTSFALSFLRCLTANPDIVGEAAGNLKVLVFNVKQEDLLWLDKPNSHIGEEEKQQWESLGVPAQPFPSVSFWAPPRNADVPIPDTDTRAEGVEAFSWTPAEFISRGLLRFLFTESDDYRNQLTFLEERVRAQLQKRAEEDPSSPGVVSIEGKKIRSLEDLVDVVEGYLDPDGDDPDQTWTGRTAPGTILAFMRRLRAAQGRVGRLIRTDGRRVDRASEAVTVVDLHKLHDFGQRFVVGAILDEVFAEKEQTGQRLPLQVVLLDELNKYAPREGHSPIKETLIDIAQRGRSLGVILIGAQQTASRVASQVTENASIRVTGRLDAAEAERAEYGWLLPSTRARARLFKPGTMVIFQPGIPAPLVFSFPFPPWATRKEEAVMDKDPFEGLA